MFFTNHSPQHENSLANTNAMFWWVSQALLLHLTANLGDSQKWHQKRVERTVNSVNSFAGSGKCLQIPIEMWIFLLPNETQFFFVEKKTLVISEHFFKAKTLLINVLLNVNVSNKTEDDSINSRIKPKDNLYWTLYCPSHLNSEMSC